MNYRYNGDDKDKDIYDPDGAKNKFGAGSVLKWIIYSVCIFIAASVIFRLITTGPPGELKNYIIKSESVAGAYAKSGNDLIIYKIDVRSSFALGDALFIDNVYYIEAAENLQLTLRLKTSRFPDLKGETPFRPLLTLGLDDEREVIRPSVCYPTGKPENKYRYFSYSFDGVKINYAKSILELFIFLENEENFPDEEYAAAKFMIFNINMPKSKVPAKNFDLG